MPDTWCLTQITTAHRVYRAASPLALIDDLMSDSRLILAFDDDGREVFIAPAAVVTVVELAEPLLLERHD